MAVLNVARLFACKAMWAAGLESAGRCLLTALDSPHEDVRTVAGMFLVQGGQRALPLIREAIERREHLPMALTIAGDIGAHDLAPQIQGLTAHTDPQISRAARDALDILALQKNTASTSA